MRIVSAIITSLLFIACVLSAGAQTTGIHPGTTFPLSRMFYHRGPVMLEPNVYVIWYGNWNRTNHTDTAEGQQIVRDFLNAIGGSPYFAINTTYSVSNMTISGKVSFAGETTDNGSHGRALSPGMLRSVVTNAVGSGALPTDTNGVYFVLTSSDVTETSGFCSHFCAYHYRILFRGADLKYAFVGNFARCPVICTPQPTHSPNGNPGVDGMVSAIAHELSEAVTDPDHNAWFDLQGFENADKCAWTYGHHQYKALNGTWANMGWDYFDGSGAFLYHRDFLIQRNLLRTNTRSGFRVDFCATSYDPASGAAQQ